MAYYLSKDNRQLMDELVVPFLKKSEDATVKLRVSSPRRLESIIRSATSLPEYSWIKEKFIIRTRRDEVWFEARQLVILEIEPDYETIADQADFFTILNILLLQERSNRVRFTHVVLTDDELTQLQNWGNKHSYEIQIKNKMLEVKRVNGQAKD